MKTHPRSTVSYPVRTRVRTCYLPFSVACGLASPTLTTQPQTVITVIITCIMYEHLTLVVVFCILASLPILPMRLSSFSRMRSFSTSHDFWMSINRCSNCWALNLTPAAAIIDWMLSMTTDVSPFYNITKHGVSYKGNYINNGTVY